MTNPDAQAQNPISSDRPVRDADSLWIELDADTVGAVKRWEQVSKVRPTLTAVAAAIKRAEENRQHHVDQLDRIDHYLRYRADNPRTTVTSTKSTAASHYHDHHCLTTHPGESHYDWQYGL